MHKKVLILSILFSILCAFSTVSAYQSLWDQIPATEEPASISIKQGLQSTNQIKNVLEIKETPESTRTEGIIRLNSFEIKGAADPEIDAFLQLLNGTQILYAAQSGDFLITSLDLSLGGTSLFSFDSQATEPYYFKSSLLGTGVYKISAEDQFEEKLAAALYNIFAAMSEDTADLPDLEDIYEIIRSIRESGGISVANTAIDYSSLNQDLNTNAFDLVLMVLILRFQETQPTVTNEYLFTDMPTFSRVYEWPSVTKLPEFSASVSAVSATYTKNDLVLLLNALSQFFADNPEFTEILNLQIQMNMLNSYPELAAMDDIDYLSELLSMLKEELIESMEDFELTIKIDQDKNGAPTLISVEFSMPGYSGKEGFVLYLHNTTDDPIPLDSVRTTYEFAVDVFSGRQRAPLLRGLVVNDESWETGNTKNIYLRYDNGNNGHFEYKQHTNFSMEYSESDLSESRINYDLNGDSGYAYITSESTPNRFGSEDKTTDVYYEHRPKGDTAFTIDLTLESKATEPLPGMDTVESIAASDMTQNDYEMLASNIFMQIMMLSMSMMQ